MWRVILLWCCSVAVWAADAPVLRLETGMHTAPIRRISVDAAQRFVVTASHDKTARVWDLASGQLLQVLRPPLGAGDEGKLYAVALSPDGQEVALGGWTDEQNSIYLFDRASGRLTRRISGLPNVINHLRYSRDGQQLAAAIWGKGGIRLYRRSDGAEIGRDSDYGSDSYGLDFDAGGRLVSSCYDGYVRLYAPGLKLLRKVAPSGGQQPYSVRFSPDGQRLALGFHDSTVVQVLSGDDLRLLYAADTAQVNNGSLNSVAWSADGQMLYAGGSIGMVLARLSCAGIRPDAGRGRSCLPAATP